MGKISPKSQLKFYVRRAVAGVIGIPFIAGAYTFLYLTFLVLGGDTNQTIDETYNNGLLIGGVVAVVVTFLPQFYKFVNYISGEGK